MGLLGKKLGMTRFFYKNGSADAVTVIEVKPNVVSQIKLQVTDGYDAIQLTTGERRLSQLSKSIVGHFSKSNISAGGLTKEFRLSSEEVSHCSVGDVFGVSLFTEGQRVDVQGQSIGRGFAGTIKRHNFSGQRKTHGNSLSHRVPGSIGQNQTPGRVFKGKKMSGHLGSKTCSIQNLEIVRVDKGRNLLLIKGAVPGPKGNLVIIRPSIKM